MLRLYRRVTMSSVYAPILDGAVLWHPWERAILLNGYQFVIVAYKVELPKTSGRKFQRGNINNSTKISALEWYLKWERDIANLTQRSLALTTISNAEVRTRVRLPKYTCKINFIKRNKFLVPRVIFNRNTVLPITQSFVSVQTSSQFTNLSSTLNSTLIINATHSKTMETTTYSLSHITKRVSQPGNTIGPLLLVQEAPNKTLLLRTNDQEMVRSI